MWRRRSLGGWGRRRATGRRSIMPYSFAGTVLLVSAGVLLLLYLLGYLAL
jgi:hypothetical protein